MTFLRIASSLAVIAASLSLPAAAQDSGEAKRVDHAKAAADAAADAAEAAADAADAAAAEMWAEAYEGEDYPEPYPLDGKFSVITPADYPAEAWRSGMEGAVGYELAVDAEGMVTDCTIVESSGFELLDAATCPIARERHTFDPARDENGNPVAGTFVAYAEWQKREPEFGDGFRIKVRFTLDESGVAQNCEMLEVSENLPEDMARSFEGEPCPKGRQGVPYRDAEGNPVARTVTVAVAVEVADPAE